MFSKKSSESFEQGQQKMEEIGRRLGSLIGQDKLQSTGAAGFLNGLGTLIEQLGKLSEQAEKAGGELVRSGTLDLGSNKRVTGVYGFTVKSALDKKSVKVEPFGNMRKDEALGQVEIQEIREPMIDMFDEPDHLLIVAEVPGVVHDNVKLELRDDILVFSAEKGDKKYRKEILLPDSYASDKMSFSCRNGILEIKILKQASGS